LHAGFIDKRTPFRKGEFSEVHMTQKGSDFVEHILVPVMHLVLDKKENLQNGYKKLKSSF
jgi:hypothetical protein